MRVDSTWLTIRWFLCASYRVVDIFDRPHSFASNMSLSTLLLSSAGVCCTKTEPTLRCNKSLGKTQTYHTWVGLCVVFLYFSMKLTLSTDYHSAVSLLLLHCTPNSWVLWNGSFRWAYHLIWKWPCMEMAMYKSGHAVSDHHKLYEQVLTKIQWKW